MEPEEVGKVLKGFMDDGYTVLKILSVELLMAQEGNYCGPLDWVNELRAAEEKVRRVAKGRFLRPMPSCMTSIASRILLPICT